MAIQGVCPVLALPFTADGEVDLPSFRNVVRWIISLKTEQVMIFGVASENIKLTDPERIQILTALMEEKDGSSLKVIASVADHSMELAIERAKLWESMGADYINILPPSNFSPSKEQTLEHLRGVLGAVKIPVIIQHLPQAGGMDDVSDIAMLHKEFANLAMIKCEANPPMESIERVAAITNKEVDTLVGWGGIRWLEGSHAGAVGVQPGCSMTDAYLWAEDALNRNDDKEFTDRLNKFIPWITHWITNLEQLIAIEKEILFRRGIIANSYCRRPTVNIHTDELEKEITAALNFLKEVPSHV